MARALVGDSDRPTVGYVPPPIQRLSLPLAISKSPPSPVSPSQPPSAGPSCPKPFPYLHRLEIVDDMPSRCKKSSLLQLRLSSPSFLDAVAMDLASEKPLYSVETVTSSTTIWRSDPWDGSAKIADIRWPRELPLKGKGRDNAHGALVQMNGSRWKDSSSFLKDGSIGCSRKFNIPHHQHTLKWKRSGNGDVFQCTTATCKGPVATLQTFPDDTPPTLKVFETLGNLHESVPQLDHAGISLSLLDHLFVTALLLVTEPEDWMTIPHNPTLLDNPSTDALARPKSASVKTPASARQWRKIMYGEPLYPSLKTPAFDNGVDVPRQDADVLDIPGTAQLPTSIQQWRKIVYGEPLYPSLRPQSADGVDLPPRPNTAWDTASISSESAYYPATPSSDPSTGFFDVLPFFDDSERTLPRINTDNRRHTSPLSFSPAPVSPVPSSECMPSSALPSPSPRTGVRRELPAPPSSYNPPASIQPWLHRSRSSPRLSPATPDHKPWVIEDDAGTPPSSVDDRDRKDPSGGTRSRALSSGPNVRRRQLPTVPPTPTSQSQPRAVGEKRLSQIYQRSLPPTPGSGPISRSPSASGHRHVYSQSQAMTSQPMRRTTSARPATAQEEGGAAQGRRQRHEKNPHELINWMRNVTRAHHRRILEGENEDHPDGPDDAVYEPPPPAYNAIDFSTPPEARSPAGANC